MNEARRNMPKHISEILSRAENAWPMVLRSRMRHCGQVELEKGAFRNWLSAHLWRGELFRLPALAGLFFILFLTAQAVHAQGGDREILTDRLGQKWRAVRPARVFEGQRL